MTLSPWPFHRAEAELMWTKGSVSLHPLVTSGHLSYVPLVIQEVHEVHSEYEWSCKDEGGVY